MGHMMRARERLLVAAASIVLGCGGGGGFPVDAGMDGPAPGTFSVAWSVTNTSDQVISCDSIGAQSMTALLRNRAVQGGSTQIFTCQTLGGTSEPIAPGLYDLNFELVGSGGAPTTGLIATAPAQMGVTIASGQNVQLSPVTFVVDATGALELSLATNTSGGNCASGAGITATTITLERASDQACQPVTFAISAGASSSAGTYTVNCAAPVPGPCIDADQKLTASGIPAGNYVIRVRGYKGGALCWTNNDTLPVPPLGRALIRTLNLAFQTGTTGC
jgi:hypothetical protein